MGWRIEIQSGDTLPIDVDGLSPERLRGLSRAEIERLEVGVGNARRPLAELATVEMRGEGERLELTGATARVDGLASGMSHGEVVVEGDIGCNCAAGLRGGRVEIRGAADLWLGAELRGGTIVLSGDAAAGLGGSYPGSRRGMRGGAIYVLGSAGDETALRMRRGLIVVQGDVGQAAAADMLAGTLIFGGRAGPHLASGMRRGSVIALAPPPDLGPMFRRACEFAPQFLRLYAQEIAREPGFAALAQALAARRFVRYTGDLRSGARGEVLAAMG